ncbi:hypothetical protein [Paenibacillus sp. AR247]|uniref:hypothetical protein n=1 Tax=Paenibacillus sp. AR247 TaxID=1631599 RepID=UPI000CF8EF42|nr:hypothetical protein [Paenibacillus sp. AR247]PQP88556.1 hypothetical protein CPT76_09475 [Paenibacillus sp. AR247]
MKTGVVKISSISTEVRLNLLRTLHLLIILVLIASVTIIAGCQGESNKDTFPEVGQSLSKSIKQIDKQPGILLTGFAANLKVKRYKVGIEYDPGQISNDQLKQIITDYLSHAASNLSPPNNWEEMLKPYQLRIEKLGDAQKAPVIAEKDIGSTEIKWFFE